MKKKKMKLWKKIIIIILLFYVITIIYKLIILTKISKNYVKNKNITNFSCYIKSETSNTYYVQKDNIKKLKLEEINDNEVMIFWENEKTNEKLLFNEKDKICEEFREMPFNLNVSSSMLSTDLFGIRLIYALNPTTIIISNYKYYNIIYLLSGVNKEKVDKLTGLLITSDGINGKKEYKYETITDDMVDKPNLTEYEIIN